MASAVFSFPNTAADATSSAFDPFIGERAVCGAFSPPQKLSPYHVAVAALAEIGRIDLVRVVAPGSESAWLDVWGTLWHDLHDNERRLVRRALALAREKGTNAETPVPFRR